MAKRTTVLLEDDLDGGKADESVFFSLDGTVYEIDLSAKNAEKLRRAFSIYVTAGRRLGRTPGHGQTGRIPAQRRGLAGDTAAIRQWAQDNGYPVRSRGRIAAEIREAYSAST